MVKVGSHPVNLFFFDDRSRRSICAMAELEILAVILLPILADPCRPEKAYPTEKSSDGPMLIRSATSKPSMGIVRNVSVSE